MILAIIPARGGSKGIPRKNIYPLNGKPLIQYTIDAAKNSKICDTVISTDDDEIAKYWQTIKRPAKLARDDTPTLPVIQYTVKEYEKMAKRKVDYVITLQPTSPLRLAEDINNAIDLIIAEGRDSLVSVCEGIHPLKSYFTKEGFEPVPCMKPMPYDKHVHTCITRNGAIFITSRELLETALVGTPSFYVMPKTRSIDIDDYEDLMIAEALLKKGELQ